MSNKLHYLKVQNLIRFDICIYTTHTWEIISPVKIMNTPIISKVSPGPSVIHSPIPHPIRPQATTDLLSVTIGSFANLEFT